MPDKLEPVRMDTSSHTKCLPNTMARMDILKFIVNWVNDARSEQWMHWIHGLVGSGKIYFIYHIRQHLEGFCPVEGISIL